jgi:hypothetical protein
MPRTKGSVIFDRDQISAMKAFHVGVDALGTFSNEHKCYKDITEYDSYKHSAMYGKKESGFAGIVAEIVEASDFAGSRHFPKFMEYTQSDEFKSWKTGFDSIAAFQKNLALGTAALLVDVKAQYDAVREVCDDNIDAFKRRLFELGEKRAREDVKAASNRCINFKHRYNETRREMEMLAQSCGDVGDYLGVLDQYYLHD